MADIQRLCGSFDPPEMGEEMTVITGTAPVATMRGYAREVVRYTHGSGRLVCALKGYDVCHDPEEVIAAFGYDPDADTDNPADSVFCSHGAGHTVRWNEVPKHMHLPGWFDKSGKPSETTRERIFRQARTQNDVFAADKELMRIFEQTYGAIQKRSAPEKRRFTSTPDSRYKGKKTPRYDGEEYVLVDGYNVIFAWENLRLMAADDIAAAREALINILCNYQGYRKCEMILVFDAYKVRGSHREVEQVNGISIVYTKEAETADTYIEKTSQQLAKNHRVRVVTSDGMEQLIILGNGALRVSSRAFYEEIREAKEEIRALISENEL